MTTTQGATAPTIALPTELIVIVDDELQYAEYRGTRAVLLAEGILPQAIEFPQAYDDLKWLANGLDYWLRRHRPDGAKGPRKAFADCDWWHLRIQSPDSTSWKDVGIRRTLKELARLTWLDTEAGRLQSNRACKAYGDKAYLGFMSAAIGGPYDWYARKIKCMFPALQREESRHG